MEDVGVNCIFLWCFGGFVGVWSGRREEGWLLRILLWIELFFWVFLSIVVWRGDGGEFFCYCWVVVFFVVVIWRLLFGVRLERLGDDSESESKFIYYDWKSWLIIIEFVLSYFIWKLFNEEY